jgi:hypothetical protein
MKVKFKITITEKRGDLMKLKYKAPWNSPARSVSHREYIRSSSDSSMAFDQCDRCFADRRRMGFV